MTNEVDLAIIGGGSSAFAAAIKAAESGVSILLINHGTIGGTCVNVGCVPSKMQIQAASVVHNRNHVTFDGVKQSSAIAFDLEKHRIQQNNRVTELRQEKYVNVIKDFSNVRIMEGKAKLTGNKELQVKENNGNIVNVEFRKAIIATGSSALIPNIEGLKETPYWTSTEALSNKELPSRLIVVGGSYIALELGQSYQRLGSQVTLLARSTLLSKEDPLVGSYTAKLFKQEGMSIHLHCSIRKVAYEQNEFVVYCEDEQCIRGDKLLVATGRMPNTSDLGLEEIGVQVDEHQGIVVNDYLETTCPDIFAVGDCTNIPKYVYVAAACGTKAVQNALCGWSSDCCKPDGVTDSMVRFDPSIIPGVVFSDPSIATVGLTEREAISRGIMVDSRVLYLSHVPRALVNFDERGFIKLVVEKNNFKLLGACIVSPCSGEMIQVVALAIRNGMTVCQLSDELFPYLTFVEGIKLCAQMFFKDISKLSCCAG
eukprot:jgi/Galph1/2550/GphlegSOOS_G1199.1